MAGLKDRGNKKTKPSLENVAKTIQLMTPEIFEWYDHTQKFNNSTVNPACDPQSQKTNLKDEHYKSFCV